LSRAIPILAYKSIITIYFCDGHSYLLNTKLSVIPTLKKNYSSNEKQISEIVLEQYTSG